MPHARAQILSAAAALLANLPTTGSRCHVSRANPAPAEQGPFLLVYARREQSAPLTMGGANRKLQHELVFAVEGIAPEAGDSDDTLHAISLEVAAALHADPTLGGKAKDLYLSSTELLARVEGESRIGHIRLEFTVRYFTVATAPDTAV